MNQVHKVIWSRVKNCYIVVSEITKRVGRDNKASVTGIRPLRALLCAMVIAGCMLPADADAWSGLIHAGTGATASGDSSIAYGYGAKAKKPHAVAQGTEAEADGVYALAFGYKVQTLANYAIAMGHQAKAGADAIGGVAIGSSSVVEGEHGVALGDQAESKNKQAIAVGLKSVSSGEQSISIGHQANAKGNNSIAAGAEAKGYAKDGIAIGNNAESGTANNKDPRIPSIESNNGVAVGNSAKASGGSSVSVGNDSIGNGPSSVAIGNAATANDVRTTAIGNNAHAEGAGSLSIGREASALTLENATSTNPLVTGTDEQLDKKGVMAIGDDAKASGNNSIALGTSAKAGDLEKTRNADSVTLTGSAKRITKLTTKRSVNNAVAIGTESSVQSDEDIAVGYRATTVASKYHQRPGSGQVAIGSNSNTYGTRGDVAIGSGAETNIRVKNVDHTTGAVEKPDGQSVAIGSVAKAYGSQAVAVGADTRAIGNSSVAIGTDDIELDRDKLKNLLPGLANNENLNNKAPNDATLGSAALGDKPYYVKTASIGTASVALGAMSQAAGDASMAMGLNALAEGDASTAIGPLARSKGEKSIAMGVNANSQVDGGVALGADSVSNRQQTSNAYIPSGADTAQVNAIKATKGTTGAVSVGSDTVKRQIINVAAGTDDSDAVNVAQLKAVTSNASWTAQGNGSDVNAVKNGSKVNFADGTNTTASVTKDASGKVTTVKYNLKKDVDLGPNGSLIINGNTYINKDGINAGNKQITNVASGGDTITNAANIGDINRIVEAKDKYVTGGTANYQTNGDGTAALTGTNGLTADITGLKNNYVTTGSVSNDGKTLTLERNDTGKVNVDLSKIFTEVAKEDYHLVANPEAGSQGKYKADSSGNMVLTVANEKGDRKQVTLTDIASKAQQNTNTTNITNINNTIGKGLNFGGDSGAVINKKLGEKLEIKGGASADLTDGNIGVVSDGAKLNVKLKKDVDLGPNGSLTINGKTYVNKDGLNANGQKITNVADGTANSDAVNLGQLNAAIGGTAKATTVKAKDANVTVTEGTNAAGGKEYTVGLGDKVTLGSAADKKIIVDGTSGKITAGSKVTIDGTTGDIQAGTVKVTGAGTVNELTNRTWDIDNPTVVHGQAATEDQLKTVSDGVKTNKTDITNINTTIGKGLNFKGDDATVINKKLGEQLDIKGGADASKLSDGNIGVVSGNGALNVKLAKDVKVDSVTTGGTVINNNGLTVGGKTYVTNNGINANNQKITNVAKGTAGTDAVNVDQLNAAIGGTAKATTVKAKDANVTVTEGTNAAGGKEYTVGLGDKVTLGTADKKIVADGTSGKITAGSKVTIDGTTGDIQAGTVKVTGAGTVNELTNRTWDIDNPTVVHGQAATEDQLKTVSDGVKTNKTNITNINNTIGKGLNFGGDSGAVINKKLGEKLEIKGGASADLTDDNIGVVSDGTKLNVKLKKDVNLGPDGSLTINGKTYVNKDGLNANGQKITNVANGTVNSDAVNFGQLKDAVAAGKTILKDGKNTTVEGEGTVANPYKVNVNDDLVLGKKGADGKDGSIGVNGKDGSAVVINGKDGSIGLNGKDGANGLTIKGGDGKPGVDGTNITRLIIEEKDGKKHDVATLDDGLKFAGNTGIVAKKLNETMTIKGTGTKADTEYDASNIKTMVNSNGEMIVGLDKNLKTETIVATGKDGKDGKIGINGKDGVTTNISITRDGKPGVDGAPGTTTTRIVYEKPDGTNEEVATLNDGMKYGGDTGAVIKKKLNEQVNVVGGISDESKLTTDDNIGVVSDGSNNLKVRLAKNINLGPDGSLTINGKTYVNKDGLNANGQKITNVANGTVNSDAVNFGQLKDAVAAGKTILKDGKNTTVEGEGTVANPYKVNVNDDLVLGKKGADGKDGSIGVNGKDGSAVVINGKDGSIGLNGKDGANGLTIKGGDGKPGVDGTNITRLIIEEKDGKKHDVATLDDGLKFAGNTGIVAKKLNETMTIKGTGTKADTEYDASNIKTMVNSNGEMIVGLDKNLKADSVGINGKDGRDGATIKGGDGKPGVDGTNITRLIIEEKNGKQHDIATLDDGMKYGGDTGDVIKKKLNEQVNVVGGITDESKLTTDDNIGVVSDGSNNLKVRLAKNINLGPDGSLTINGKTYVNKDGLNANGQKITNVANGTVNSDAVNFGQLKDAVAAGKTILKDGKNTTVEGEGTVANPYKVNVNDDLVLGKKGADGKDGSIGVNGKDGSSVVIHGKDGISIKGKDGKDGVTLKAKDGANGTEGQIGLTGPAGKDGKSTHADIGVNAGPASLDPAKNLSATEMTRLYYVDEKGDHQVATMDDGLKFAGNTGIVAKKLNETMTIKGTGTKADTEYDASNIKTMVNSNGEMIVGLDKNLKTETIVATGKDGKDGKIGINGKDGVTTNISITRDGKPGVDGAPGTTTTRIVYEKPDGTNEEVATLNDGMKYGGDTGAVIKKKLNEQVNVVGGISDESKLTTDDNIGVVSDGSNNLKVRLAKDVKLNSVTAGNVVMDTTGFYVKKMSRTPTGTVSLTADGLNNGGNKIINVAEGTADTDAVNFSQLKNQGSDIINKGFGVKAEDGNEVKKKLGETVDVVGDGKNISTRVEGGRVRVALKDDILLNSVTTGRTRMDTNGITVQDGSGNTAVTVDKDGLKIKDGPSVTKSGIDAGGKKITNVAAGEADTDAVNVSQLKKAAASATTKVADGKNTTVTSEDNADGSKTYHVNLNDDITLGTDPSKQISIKGSEGTIKAGQVTVNGTAGTVNGLTNKTWDPNHITSGQAATEDQLKVVSGQAGKHSSVTAGSNISVTTGTNANGGTDYKVSVVDTPTFKTVTTGNTVMSNNGLTIKNGPSITQTGVDAGGKRITNVAAGKADTDAVNVGQLKQIGGAINKVDNRINRVGAGAAALAALHPLDFDPDDKWDFTLGYGNYKDAHSLALGAFYRPNEDTMISVGGSIGGGENMVNAGLSMKLGQGNHVSTSKVAMAKEIKDLRAELENVKGALLKVADGRPLDSMDMDKMQLFPDVPENHWAYDYVATLAGNGVIVGYPDGQFGGDRMMTRYEMAALIYRAMQNGAAADDRMARALKEFEPELERIRVDTISKHKDGTPDIQRVRVIKGRG